MCWVGTLSCCHAQAARFPCAFALLCALPLALQWISSSGKHPSVRVSADVFCFRGSRFLACVVMQVIVCVQFPKVVRTADLHVTAGSCLFDEALKVTSREVGNILERTLDHQL